MADYRIFFLILGLILGDFFIFLTFKISKIKTKISHCFIIKFSNVACWVKIYYFFNGLNFTSIIYCFFVSALILLSVIDIRHGVVSDRINILIFILGFLIMLLDCHNWVSHVLGFFIISTPLLILFFFKGIGGGDIKLFAVCGFFIGWKLILLSFIFAYIIGAIYSIFIIIKDKVTVKTTIRFVPFITISVLISIFYGDFIINWYNNNIY